MPFTLGAPRSPLWPRPPDGMLPRDWSTWYLFQHEHAHRYQSFYFNVRLPTLADIPDADDPADRARFADALAKRIDAVGLRHDWHYDILEVSYSPSPSALGQLLTYRTLWNLHDLGRLGRALLIYQHLDPDLALAARTHHIEPILVTPIALVAPHA